jgi:ribosomal protein S18 acetylase RimI-like enzyme
VPAAAAVALAFMRDTVAASADEVVPHAWGTLLRTPSLDTVWALNGLIVDGPRPELTLSELEALFAERFAGGRYASATLDDDELAARLEPAARERGWKVERELVMELRREPDRLADTSRVRDGSEEEVLALTDRWFAEDHAADGAETLRQLSRFAAREWRARPTRAFVSGDGLAMCKLWSDGTTAQVEDVYTAPEARGGGHARALVTHALAVAREGGHDLTFIVADADDTPKELYSRLGFDPLHTRTRIVRVDPGYPSSRMR